MDLLRLRYPQRIALAGLLFTLPAIIFFAIFFFYPMVQAFFMSLTDWSLLRPPRFVGLANYAGLFSDAVFRRSVAVTALYVAGVCGGAIPGALIFAAFLRSPPLQVFVKVTLPLLGTVLLLTLVVGVSNAVQMFVPQYVVTRGGPADSTRVLVLLIYETAFRYLRMGEAAAMSIVLLQLLVLFTIAQFRLFGRVEPL